MPLCDFIAGWGGGMVGLVVGHPVDTVKVNQQTQGVRIRECIRIIYHNQGVKGFFRGMAFPLIAQGAMNSVFFGVYGRTLEHLHNRSTEFKEFCVEKNRHPDASLKHAGGISGGDQEISYINCFIAGLAGGLAQLSIACPVDVIKIKLQTSTAKEAAFRGPTVLLKHISSTHGAIRGLYQGVGTMAVRDMPASAVYMCFYELGSNFVNKWNANGNQMKHSAGLFLAGGIAGIVSWWIILPFDVIKSQIQFQDPKSMNYRGPLKTIQYIFKHQGFKGFTRGFCAVSVRAFPVNGATLLSYEWFKHLCQNVIETDTPNTRLTIKSFVDQNCNPK